MIEKIFDDMGGKTAVFATGVSVDELKTAKAEIVKILKENNMSVEATRYIFEEITLEITERNNLTKIANLF